MRYMDVYNRIFFSRARIAKTRRRTDTDHHMKRVIYQIIRNAATDIPSRLCVTRHLHTLSLTQTLGARIDGATKRYIYTQHRLAHLAWVISRLRPLQRRIVEHLWRPTGRMARRIIQQGLSAIHGAEDDRRTPCFA